MRLHLRWIPTTTLMLGLLLVACSSSSNADEVTPAGRGGKTQAQVADSSAPIHISRGETIELTDYLVEGQATIFDFMSDYGPPCKRIAPLMDRLHYEREGVRVVKVDINRPDVRGIDWRSPVAQQFRLNSIPHFKIYSAEGKLMGEGERASSILNTWLQELDSSQGR